MTSSVRHLLNPDAIVRIWQQTWSRYPLAIVFVGLYICQLIWNLWSGQSDESVFSTAVHMSLWMGILLSVAAVQWGRFYALGRRTSLALQCTSALLALGTFLYLWLDDINLGNTQYIVQAASLIIVLFPLPSPAGGMQWKYTLGVLKAGITGVIAAIATALLSGLLASALTRYCGVTDTRILYTVVCLVMGLIALWVLARMPYAEPARMQTANK